MTQRGFTLLETLVAVGIFTVSILALLSVLSQGITSTNFSKKKIIATYLAQEGIEYVRNIRDTTVTSATSASTGWASFMTTVSAACGSAAGCYLPSFNSVLPCTTVCAALSYDEDTGIYGYTSTSGVDSGYVRTITYEPIAGDDNEVKINSKVTWMQGSGSYSVTFSDHLFNWIE